MSTHADASDSPFAYSAAHRKRRNRFIVVALVAFAFTSAYAAFAMVTQIDQLVFPGNELRLGKFSAPGLDVKPPDALASAEDRINIAIIGLDRRPTEEKSDLYRADSIIALTIHPYAKQASMISFPRDLWVQIPLPNGGFYEGRINEAYERGSSLRYKGGGPGLVRATLEHNFGIDIDYYVVLDFEGFVELIDAMGGIDVDIPDHVAYEYSTSEIWGSQRWFELFPGRQHLNGDDALAYSRYRQDSDLYRIQRQQRVIFASINKALSLNMLSRAPQLWDKYKDAVKTDISSFRVPGMAALLQGITTDRIQSYSLGDAVIGFQIGGASVLRLLPDQAAPIVGSAFRPPEVTKENATIAVYTSTSDAALARRTQLFLQLQGIAPENLTAGTAPAGTNYDAPLVLYRPKAKTTARFLARWLKLDAGKSLREATPQEASSLPSDIVVALPPDANPALVALPGTERGAAPASRFTGAGAPPQFDPFRPPPSAFDNQNGPRSTATPAANPFAPTPVANPFGGAPTPAPTPPANPFAATPTPRP